MSSKRRIGIIGAGFGQCVHFPAFSLRSDCEVVSVCASDELKTKKLAAILKTPETHSTWRDLIQDRSIDVVSISVPPSEQYEIARLALSQKKYVLLEKPLSLTSVQSKNLLEIATKNRTQCVVDYEFVLLSAFQKAKSLLAEKKIGVIRDIRVSWNVETYAVKHGLNNWKTNVSQGGGALYNFGSHVIHYLLWMFGPIQSVSATLQKAPDLKFESDTIALLHLSFKSGIIASVSISTHATGCHEHRIEIFGTEGVMMIDNSTPDYIHGFELFFGKSKSTLKKQHLRPRSKKRIQDGRISAVSQVIETLFSSKNDASYKAINLKSAHAVQELIDQLMLSNKKGRRIDQN